MNDPEKTEIYRTQLWASRGSAAQFRFKKHRPGKKYFCDTTYYRRLL
jgi:hypothetical protein